MNCTKAKPILVNDYYREKVNEVDWETIDHYKLLKGTSDYLPMLNGKVVAKFTLNKISKANFDTAQFNPNLLKNACLTEKELVDYLGERHLRSWSDFYVWHIDNLVIFDEPMELLEFVSESLINAEWFKYYHECMLYGVFPPLSEEMFKKLIYLGKAPKEVIDSCRLIKAPQAYQFIYVKE